MKRRCISLIAILTVAFSALGIRIYFLGDSGYAEAAVRNNTKVVTAISKRGTIYDCNMNPLTDTSNMYAASVVMTKDSLSAMRSLLSQDEFEKLIERLEQGGPAVAEIFNPNVNVQGVCVINGKKRYSTNQLAPHIIGYLDGSGTGVSGIERAYDSYLNEVGGEIDVRYHCDAIGKILIGEEPSIENNGYDSKAGVKLTIDAEMQKLLERIVKLNIRAGAAVILETETGNIKAMTSVPEFSPDDISEDISAADAPLLNRALNPYSVGSVFKIVTAAACLENGFDAEKQYNCTGSITVGQNTFNCINEKGHGRVDMERALEVSCNCYFIHAGLEVGGDKILEMAEKLGFGKSTELAGGIVSAAGKLPSERNLASPAATANFAFGQGELMATTVQIACMVSAIANGGTYLEPKLVIGLTNAEGEVSQPAESGNSYRAVSDQTAEILKNYMISVVENGSGKSAKPENGGAGGKTATAQSGWYDDEGEIYHTWFAGFYPAEDPKYTIVLIKEDGNSGSKDCAPLFKQIVDGIDELSNS